jgi:Zn-dependent M16 (insulinase) family peptidase
VLAHSLSTGRLWEEIRTKGGAYGAYAGVEGLERHFSFSTYRDPAPLKSLQAFSEVLGELSKPGAFSADDADKAVIGCFGRETSPHTPREKGSIDFSRYLYGITEEQRREKLRSIVAMREGDLEDAAKRLGAQSGKGAQVLIASPPLAEAAAKVLGVEVEKLPV